jgi:ABC-type transport system substrate-binding protein
MNQRIYSSRFFVLVLLAMFLLAACQPQTPASTEEPAEMPTQPAAATESPADPAPDDPNAVSPDILLDPALGLDADSIKINQHLYTGLVVLDASGAVQPAVAESWTVSDDELTYIFTLRSNAAFSDGSAITPDDVVDNVTRWLDPQSPLRGSGNYETWQEVFLGFLGEKDADGHPLSSVDGVQKVDFNTVILHLNRPVPEFLTYLANPAFSMLKPASLESGDYGTISSSIISSGPYLVSSWTSDSLILAPNPAYWGEVPQANMEFSFR